MTRLINNGWCLITGEAAITQNHQSSANDYHTNHRLTPELPPSRPTISRLKCAYPEAVITPQGSDAPRRPVKKETFPKPPNKAATPGNSEWPPQPGFPTITEACQPSVPISQGSPKKRKTSRQHLCSLTPPGGTRWRRQVGIDHTQVVFRRNLERLKWLWEVKDVHVIVSFILFRCEIH